MPQLRRIDIFLGALLLTIYYGAKTLQKGSAEDVDMIVDNGH